MNARDLPSDGLLIAEEIIDRETVTEVSSPAVLRRGLVDGPDVTGRAGQAGGTACSRIHR